MMIYEELIKFIKEDRFKNPKWKKYFNGYQEFAEFYRSLNTEIDKHDLGIYEKDNVAYLLSLESPYFFSYEITNKDARVVLITYNSDDKIINVAYSEMYSLSKNPDEFRALCERLQEDNYKEISFDDYADIIGDTYRKKTDATISLINETVEEMLEIKNSYAEEYKKNPEIVSEFYMHDYFYQIVSYKNKIGWKVSFDTRKELSKNEYSALPITETVYGIPVISIEKCFENSDIVAAPHIPDTVIDMRKAFMDCSKMRYAENLPSKVEKIDYAFVDCSSLWEIGWKEIPETVQTVRCAFAGSAITNAPDFSKATKITSMQETFRDSAVFTITWAPNVKKAKRTYKNCDFLIGVNKFPEYIESLEETFAGCRELRSVAGINHSKSLKSMNGTFLDCFSLENISDLPDELEEMKETFSHCSSLSYCPVLPETVRKVDGVFDSCKSFNHTSDIELDEENHTIKGIVYYGHYSCKFSFDYLKVKEEILQNAKANSKFYEYRAFCCNGIRKNAECEPIGSDTLPFVINENIGYVKYLISDGFRDDEIDDILKLLEIKKA